MRINPKTLTTLGVHLHGRRIGALTRLAGERQFFSIEPAYSDDPERPP
jgi:hypothetical protein